MADVSHGFARGYVPNGGRFESLCRDLCKSWRAPGWTRAAKRTRIIGLDSPPLKTLFSLFIPLSLSFSLAYKRLALHRSWIYAFSPSLSSGKSLPEILNLLSIPSCLIFQTSYTYCCCKSRFLNVHIYLYYA